MVNSDSTALDISHLYKSFTSVEVLKDVNIRMEQGAFLVLVGPSGCGKSTLLNCIAGLEETTSGAVTINDRTVTNLPPRDRDIAMVFQSYALYPTMSVGENIAFGMKIRKLDKALIDEKVLATARLLQIENLLDRRPGQLSGGQRQRVAMGRALVREPALFLFDEPLSNLDAKLRVEMRAEMKRLHATTGTSIVYVTHDQVEAMTLATKIVVMKDGVVQQIGTPSEIYRNPANTFVADFMGSPPMNLMDVQVEGRDTLRLPDGQVLTGVPLSDAAREKGALTLGVRPEAFSLGSMITVAPSFCENTGSDTFLSFPIADHQITARLAWSVSPETSVGLDMDVQQLRFFDKTSGHAIP